MARFESQMFVSWVQGEGQALPRAFEGVTQDTRGLKPGCLYVALRGERVDGHDYVAEALARGAAAALVSQAWRPPGGTDGLPLIRVADTRQALTDAARAWRRRSAARMIGVGGCAGKTTVKEMTAALVSARGPVCATPGNYNNEIGLPLSLLTLEPEDQFGVFEVGTNQPGEIARLAATLAPQAAIITSIGRAHIEHFGSLEAIVREEGALFEALPADGFAVIGRETACFDQVAGRSRARVITGSLEGAAADYLGEPLDLLTGALRVTETRTGQATTLRSGLPGRHNAANLLLAFAASRALDVPADAAAAALQRMTRPPMRWQETTRDGIRIINDAYNASPESMAVVLRTFMAQPCEGRRVVALGDMLELGAFSEALHREIGALVAELQPDLFFAVGARMSEAAADEAVRRGFPGARIERFPDTAAAAPAVRAAARPGDHVLLKASRGIRLEGVLHAW